MARLILMLLAFLVASPAWAQQTDEQVWFQANGNTKLSDKTVLTVEAIGRFSDKAGGFAHDEFGGSLTYKLSKNVDVAIGYRHVDDYVGGVARPNEERLRQVVTVALGHGFATRLRFEQRFNSSGSGIGVRLRPQLRFNHRISRGGVEVFATQEHFLNFNTTAWGQRSGYERMRNAIGLSIPLSKQVKTDIGYLNQYRFGRNGARDQMDHAATMALTLSL